MGNRNIKITIFTEGTILMPESAIGHSRDKIVQKVINHDPSVKNYATIDYLPDDIGLLRMQK